MKLPLNLSNYINVNYECITLKICQYPESFDGYQNLRLVFEFDGKELVDLTVAPDEILLPNMGYVDILNNPWLERFITDNELGYNCFADHYINGEKYSLFSFSPKKLKELSPEEYKAYYDYTKLFRIKTLPLNERLQREKKEHWNATKKMIWHPSEKISKGKYKTSTEHRRNCKKYYRKSEMLTANIPEDVFSEIISHGLTPSKLLTQLVLENLE